MISSDHFHIRTVQRNKPHKNIRVCAYHLMVSNVGVRGLKRTVYSSACISLQGESEGS